MSHEIIYSRTLSKEDDGITMDRSYSKDSGIDRDYSLNSPKETESNVRRNSSGSSDSSMSNTSRKQATLNEIQDLYTALHDLVKTNVTATPFVMKNQSFLTSTPDEIRCSPRGSPKFRPNPPIKVNELSTIFIDTRDGKMTRLSSSSVVDDNKTGYLLKHRRGHSAGNAEGMKVKKSPLSNRKISNDSEAANSEDEKHRKTHRSASTGEKIKKDSKSLRNSLNKSEAKSNKRWKPKLLSKLRTKSTYSAEGENEGKCASESEASFTPPLSDKNRCSSDADIKKMKKKSTKNKNHCANNSCPPVRKKLTQEHKIEDDSKSVSTLCADNVKNIDRLVASINIDYCSAEQNQDTISTVKFPENNFDELSSWFEKAAAEAVLNKVKLNSDAELSFLNDSKGKKSDIVESCRKNSAKSSGKKLVTLKRGYSAGKNDKKRQLRRPVLKSRDMGNSSMHSYSTPNLNDENYDSDASDLDSSLCTDVNSSPNGTRRSINLAEQVSRLPKTPLFYVPDTNLACPSTLQMAHINKCLQTDIFYTNDKQSTENQKEIQSRTDEKSCNGESSIIQINQTKCDEKKPKSLFTVGNYIEFKIEVNDVTVDNNANFCEATELNKVKIREVTSNGVVQDTSFWNHLSSSANEKKMTIMT